MSPSSCVKTALLFLVPMAGGLAQDSQQTEVSICTDIGKIVVEIDAENAPLHAANFLSYVERGFYSGTVFHRVISDFMIQGGGYDRQFDEKPTLEDIENESRNGLSNARGTIAAARTSDPHSARSQFFINLVDNPRLDGSGRDWGYTVFGRVTEGMEVVDQIGALPTHRAGPFPTDVPDPLVEIYSIARLDRAVLEAIPEAELSDRLMSQVRMHFEQGGASSALEWIGHYRASCLRADAELLLLEARSAAQLQKMPRARSALDEFLSISSDEHPAYAEAIELYGIVAPGANPSGALTFGECRAPRPPEVPDGTRQDLAAMIEAQAEVVAFMRDSETYLECLDEFIDDNDDDRTVHNNALNEYNRMVDITQRLGDEYNEQVRAFRERQ